MFSSMIIPRVTAKIDTCLYFFFVGTLPSWLPKNYAGIIEQWTLFKKTNSKQQGSPVTAFCKSANDRDLGI